jgi:hypothetical protein
MLGGIFEAEFKWNANEDARRHRSRFIKAIGLVGRGYVEFESLRFLEGVEEIFDCAHGADRDDNVLEKGTLHLSFETRFLLGARLIEINHIRAGYLGDAPQSLFVRASAVLSAFDLFNHPNR